MNISEMIAEAKNLVEDGDNIEYTRGICELIASLSGIENVDTGDRTIQVANAIGVSQDNSAKFYS